MTSDLGGITRRQQATWAAGDFQRIGVSQLVVGENLVRALHVHAGERVLDVAAGAGNTALAAARRGAVVTCTDYVPELLEQADARAALEGLAIATRVADAQDLPFPDGSMDVVTSTFGVMFAPDQERAAAELLRVTRPGGRIGLANWTPDSWVGRQFALQGRYLPPPPGVPRPGLWGTEEHLRRLFGDAIASMSVRTRSFEFCAPSAEALFQLFSQFFGPVVAVWRALDAGGRAAFRRDWLALTDELNAAADGTVEMPSGYLEVVAVRA